MARDEPVSHVERLPDFLVIGVPRAGTTALSKYLDAHPQVFVADDKELNFFDRQEPTPERVAYYTRYFADAAPDQVAGEATPAYMHSPVAAERMAAVVPEARLAAILREPVSRAYSHYWWRRLWRREDRPFAQAVDDELAGQAPRGGEYLGFGYYYEQLARVVDHYPRSALLTLLLDDLAREPVSTFVRLCEHLGVDSSVVPDIVGRRINDTYDLRSFALWQALTKGRAKRGWHTPVVRWIDARNAFPYRPPPMDDGIRERLKEHFAPENRKLAEWLGRDLSGWSN
jgi:hypothetical protein